MCEEQNRIQRPLCARLHRCACVNIGCTPTKTMVASARVAYLARRGALYGVHTGPISVGLQAVRERKQGMVEGARNNFKNRITTVQGLDLDLLRGEAHFSAPKTLEVSLADGETREITAPLIFIDTGARHSTQPYNGYAKWVAALYSGNEV